MRNIEIKRHNQNDICTFNPENVNDMFNCIEEYMGTEFAECIKTCYSEYQKKINLQIANLEDQIEESEVDAEDFEAELREKDNNILDLIDLLEKLQTKIDLQLVTLKDVNNELKELTKMLSC